MKTLIRGVLGLIVILGVGGGGYYAYVQKTKVAYTSEVQVVSGELKQENKPASRIVMERAMQVVREEKPTPPQSSRFYAVVARQYYENRQNNKEYATSTLLEILHEIKKGDSQEIKNKPIGDAFWVSPQAPFSPNAGEGERFVIDAGFSYTVPSPPAFMSDEYKVALEVVKDASDNRTPEQGASINFWGGIPGTEAPAGIWQNRLWTVSKKYGLEDEKYAYVQMVLAESVADSFMECWKIKYTYWTKRPDMVDTRIQTAMPNPPFPAYVSGHSTVSFTAATVLAQFFPEDAVTYLRDAEEAKNSRLWAGIHFPYDNEEGKKLGIQVGEYVIQKLKIEKAL